jgi:hypothetical protein
MRSGMPVPRGVGSGIVNINANERIMIKFLNVWSARALTASFFCNEAIVSMCMETETKSRPMREAAEAPASI